MRKGFHLHDRGFTLVELVVVITIIGLLASFGSLSYQSALKDSRDARRKADLEQFKDAVVWYQVKEGQGPSEEGWCQTSIGTSGSACPLSSPTYEWDQSSSTWADLVAGGYMDHLPTDPLNNDEYYYYYEPHNPAPNNGGWIRAKLETTGAYYYVYWNAP